MVIFKEFLQSNQNLRCFLNNFLKFCTKFNLPFHKYYFYLKLKYFQIIIFLKNFLHFSPLFNTLK